MNTTIHSSFVPFLDADASVAFYRDVLGFEVRLDVGYGDLRWITVGPVDQPDTAIVLHPLAVDIGITEQERDFLAALVAKGSYFGINLATDDLDGLFTRLDAMDVEITQEPIDQDYGLRDAEVRDPAGNRIRIQQNPKGA